MNDAVEVFNSKLKIQIWTNLLTVVWLTFPLLNFHQSKTCKRFKPIPHDHGFDNVDVLSREMVLTKIHACQNFLFHA